MKISFLQLLITLFFAAFSFANTGLSQEMLDRSVTLKAERTELRKVLRQIEEQTNVRFAYSQRTIRANRKVDIDVSRQKLSVALNRLLTPLNIRYQEVSGRILLMADGEGPSSSVGVPGVEGTSPAPQLRELKGKVRDEKGEGLPGVSVMLKGTQRGTTTDINGNFQLDVPNGEATLIFSFVGYVTQEIVPGNQSVLEITMKEDHKALEEVVVVGYGEQKRVSVTGAVSTVTSDEIRSTSSASLAVALAGKLPGLTSLQSAGGQPGRDDATMYLRGAATTNSSSPLILIDGVPRDNIRTIDPQEVESVSILKDASATAVFGVRGANGVIIITTKRGNNRRTEFNVTAEQTFTSLTREPERLHAADYMRLRNEALANDDLPILYTDDIIAKHNNPYEGLNPSDPDYENQRRIREYMYPDHDYYRMLLKKNAPQTRVNVGARGGTEKIAYFVNGTYLHQGGNLNTQPKSTLGYDPSSWMDRYSFRSNLDYKITSNFKTFLNIGAYIEKVNMPAAWLYGDDTNWMMRDLFYQAQTILPITPGPVTIGGFGVPAGAIVDPGYMDRSGFEIMNRFGYRNEVRSNLNSTLGGELDLGSWITPGLSLKGMISYDSRGTTAMSGDKTEKLYLAEVNYASNTLSYAVKRPDESRLRFRKGADSRYNINIQASINYNRAFGKHDVGAMFLYTRDNWESTGGEIPYNVLGVAGRMTYAFDNRYLGEFNMGYNGSEQFAPSKRFGFFPAVSLGWIVSNEKFMQGIDWLSQFKIRASLGKVGNDKMGSARFLYLDNITMGGGPLGSLGQGSGINQGLLGNPNITWEVALKKNLAVDLQLFGALNLTVDVFTENRSQILISRGLVPALQGVSLGNLPKANLGKVDNKGFEVELTYNKALNENFSFSIRGNYGMNKNKVIYLDEPMRSDDYAMRYLNTGLPLSSNRGLEVDYSNGNGFFNSQEELDSYLSTTKYAFGTPRPGYLKYVDQNKDGVVDDKDVVSIGYSRIPGITYGLTLGVEYKGISLTTFFQGVGRYSQNYSDQGVYEYIIRGTYFGYHRTAWTQERYDSGEEITYPALSTRPNTNHRANSFFIMNKAYLRLRNIELSYNLPKSLLQGIGVSALRIFAGGQNLLTWDKLRMDHLDPENTDSLGYPVTKNVNFGVNLTF